MSIPRSRDKCLVLGLGKSASEAQDLSRFFTVGVNDVARFHHTPDILLILDKPSRFTEERLKFISMTQPKEAAFVYYMDAWSRYLKDAPLRSIKTTKFNPNGLIYTDQVYHYRTSPFAAMSLAVTWGFDKVGILGVDLLDDHHMGRLAKDIARMFDLFAAEVMLKRGVKIVNCSPVSRLTLPYQDLEGF
jgi:hypothetical protein